MRMRVVLLVLPIALAATLALAACASASSDATPTRSILTVGASTFVGPTSLTIPAGQSIAVVDPSSTGGIHNLVTGTDGLFSSVAGAPGPLATSAGLDLQPGDTVVLTFSQRGTYHITCTIHPMMEATVTVS